MKVCYRYYIVTIELIGLPSSSVGKKKSACNEGKWKWKSLSCVQFFVTPWTIQSMEFSRPAYWSGSLSFLQGIFPTQASNPGLLHCRQILYQLSHKGSPGILEWVAYPFSSGTFQPRNQTGVSCITGGFFINKLSGKPIQSRIRVTEVWATGHEIYLYF